MKKKIRKWVIRITATCLLIVVLLLVIILNPVFTYANKTTKNNCTVFHNRRLDDSFDMRLLQATQLASKSECYNPNLKLNICLNESPVYPEIIHAMFGNAYAHGFYNKVVLMGNANFRENYVELNGYKWNLTQLLAHEMIHCYQFDKLGLWKSNPVARIPEWKWEGYPEYIARQSGNENNLKENINRLIQAEKTNTNGWIQFPDGTGTVKSYYKNWLLVQYCMDVKKMTFTQVINDSVKDETIKQQMMNWYSMQ